MTENTICKTVSQYSSKPISVEDMRKLQEIAADYAKVKNYVYQRYSGIKSLSMLYPGYAIQNEMTKSGLRERLGLPSVYFYLAVFDALRDIKVQWSKTKAAVLKRVNANDHLLEEEKHFLRYLLKVSNAFLSALDGSLLKLPKELQRQYELLASRVEVKKLENYLRRQVRKFPLRLHTDCADGFSVAERAYRYGDHGIYLSVKEKRKRIFVPLTDSNRYTRQLYVQLYPEQNRIELRVPIDVAARIHKDYNRQVGLSMGIFTMFVTDEGHRYGEELGLYQTQLSDWLREQSSIYAKNRTANSGRKKYREQKRRLQEQLHSYINQELNRFLKTEKPEVIYLPKLPRPGATGPIKRINYTATTWQRGYIKSRLTQKCKEQSITLVEVFGKDISNLCSQCSATGTKKEDIFSCPNCGYQISQRQNTAQNAKKRGEQDHKSKILDK